MTHNQWEQGKRLTMHFWVKMDIGTQMIPFTPNGIRIQFWEKANGKRKNHTRITETRLNNPGFPGPWSLGIQFLPRELLRMDPCIPCLEIPGYKDGRTVCRIRDGI